MRVLRIVLLSCAPSTAMRIVASGARGRAPTPIADTAKAALLAATLSASLLAAPPALATPTLDDAIVEVSQSSYPILGALQGETFVPFSDKLARLVLDIPPEKLGKSIDLGVDVLLSAKPEPLSSLSALVKDSFKGVETSSCTLVPLPSPAAADQFKTIATSSVDAAKLKAFADTYGPTLNALPKTSTATCLPASAALDKLALAQAEVGRSFGADEIKRFESYATPVLKSSITLGKIFPLLDDAKRLAPSATPQEKAAFTAAGKRIEGATKAEAQRLAAAKMAAAREAAAASKASPAEVAAAAKAKQDAAMRAAAEQKAAARQAELDRIAALKAKSAAVAEANK